MHVARLLHAAFVSVDGLATEGYCTVDLRSELSTVELHLPGRWLSGSPIIWIGLDLRVNLSRILQNPLTLKLAVIGSSTVQCYGL
jgi:hypothetical protein